MWKKESREAKSMENAFAQYFRADSRWLTDETGIAVNGEIGMTGGNKKW